MVWISVSTSRAENALDMIDRDFWGFPLSHPAYLHHFTTSWMEKGRFPTLQPTLKTKLSVQT